jgi:hypothetical protein
MATSSRREPDEFLIHAIHSKRCTEHGIEGDRFSVLRRARVAENLIKQWLGHSQNLMDLYAAQLQYDVAYRREWCETAGLGFELGELGYK